ncbi:MAG TPA: hypothetical protein VM450_15320 [Thermomicrobiales bacterium]|jgi:hypothetical protein|nr:hypothetical protein [Thermomicrobiales bacterium]
MSFPYPQDRNRDRRDKGGQPYKDAKEALSEQGAEIKGRVHGHHDEAAHLSEEERTHLQEERAGKRFRDIGEHVDDAS